MIGILVIILTIVNWLIYHKIFKVYYFGNMGKSILNEFVGAFVLAIIEAGIIATVGSWILGIIVFVVMIICAIAGIKGIFKAFKDAKDAFKRDFMSDKEESSEKEIESPVLEQMSEEIADEAVEVDTTEKSTVQVEDGVDVELTEVGSDKVVVIKELREITGLGLKEGKDMVDSAPVIIMKNVTKEEAEAIKIKIESCGAKVTIK